jgi:tryptophanyl-tRNA synthetase
MSKSDDDTGCILLKDADDVIMRKFKRAVTDSDMCVRYDPVEKKGIANLMSIYSAFSGKSFDEITREFEGQGYGTFKTAVAEAIIAELAPLQEEYRRPMADPAYLRDVYTRSALAAREIACKTLARVHERIGFVAR